MAGKAAIFSSVRQFSCETFKRDRHKLPPSTRYRAVQSKVAEKDIGAVIRLFAHELSKAVLLSCDFRVLNTPYLASCDIFQPSSMYLDNKYLV